MSDLQKSFARQKLDSLPIDPPLPSNTNMLDQEDRDDLKPLSSPIPALEDDSSSASSFSSTGTIRPGPGQALSRNRRDTK